MQNWEEGRSGVVVCGGGALSCQYRFDRGERAGQQRNRSNQPKPRWWRDGSEPQQVHAHTQASQCKPKQPNANHQRKPEKNSAAQRNERTAPRPRTGRGDEELGTPAEWMALGSHSLASVANGCAWGETKDTRNMHDEKRCDAMQAVTAPLALPTLSSRALLCSAGEPATKHFVKQGSISITPGFERARRAARRKMNRPWILSHGSISGPQLRASGPVVPRRPTAASGWLTGHPFRNFRYGQGHGPKSGCHAPCQALYSAFVLPGFPQVRHDAPNLPDSLTFSHERGAVSNSSYRPP
ncbi:hypothetical protein BGZ61DRAFT_477530 [Ilyonectria robusta]|uniref:uncharacterized protein n=1 Tax=Ilyonectria robusta TaxID=1079257 RepID=UPI001E8E04CB|nr:uncharacterized protein BGZ61DRAFT_477530 [Ilyonectria robusta]KAH8699534.1 hypothetical protein BGZ61DRAFT_477530 [Ilyonectria robusta]